MFIKLFYGFDEPVLPVITFRSRAAAEKLLREAAPGDVILFAATTTASTRKPEERGRLLGAAEFGSDIVPVDQLIDPELLRQEFIQDGQYRWPEALPMLRAWRFDPSPLTSEIIRDRKIGRNASSYALKVSDADRTRVQALNWTELTLPHTSEHVRQLEVAQARLRGRTRPGPLAAPGVGLVTRSPKPKAWTYAARFGNAPIWKIGHSTDLHRRLTELNAHVPVEWLEQEWRLELQQAWLDTKTALRMEQAVLNILSTHPIEGERVRCTQDDLTSAWVQALGGIPAQSDGG